MLLAYEQTCWQCYMQTELYFNLNLYIYVIYVCMLIY